MADMNNNNHEVAENAENFHKAKKKKKKAREVKYIPFPDDSVSHDDDDFYKKYSDIDTDTTKDHIQIKLEVEERRKKFGTGWLVHNVSPSFLPTSVNVEKPQFSSSIGNGEFHNLSKTSELDIQKALATDQSTKQLEDLDPAFIHSPDITSPGIYSKPFFGPSGVSTDDSESDSNNSDESELFFAHLGLSDNPIMLKLGSTHLVENDGMSGKKNQSWLLTSLLSAEMVQEEDRMCVVLKFDCLNKDKAARSYWMEDCSSAKMFLKLLYPILYKNSHEMAIKGALQCLKCESEFSESQAKNYIFPVTKESPGREVSREMKTLRKCPNCQSTALVELLQKSPNSKSADNSKDIQICGSYEIENTSMTNSPVIRPRSVSVVNKENHLNSSRVSGIKAEENDSTSSSSIECIFASAEDSGEKSTLRSQSDITVLSNPSQSSIAVISQSCSSISTSSDKNLSSTPISRYDFKPSASARAASSPVDISLPLPSRDSPWYDSSSANTTVLHSPSPRTWDMTGLCESFESCKPALDPCKVPMKEQESQRLWQLLEQEDVSYNPVKINHQVKLHMVVNVFKNEEDFVAGINGGVVREPSNNEIPGVLIISTKNVYFFKDSNNNNYSNDLQFEELEKQSLRSLTHVYTLLGSQGFGLSFIHEDSTEKTVLVILKNADMCNNFVLSLEGIIKNMIHKDPSFSQPKFQLLTDRILPNVQKEVIRASTVPDCELDESVLLFLLGSVQQPLASEKLTDPVAIVVTSQCLYLAQVLYFTQSRDPSLHFRLLQSQEIGNLTEVHLKENMRSASFHFLDEDLDQEDFWLLTAESKSSLASLLNVLKNPWEELFGIDLELTINKDCLCGL